MYNMYYIGGYVLHKYSQGCIYHEPSIFWKEIHSVGGSGFLYTCLACNKTESIKFESLNSN